MPAAGSAPAKMTWINAGRARPTYEAGVTEKPLAEDNIMAATPRARRAAQDIGPNPFAQVEGFGNMATSLAAASQAYMNAVGKCQGEICSFVTKRLTNDLEHGRKLAECKDWHQAAAIQQQWLSQAVEDYVSEGQKLMQMTTQAATTGPDTR